MILSNTSGIYYLATQADCKSLTTSSAEMILIKDYTKIHYSITSKIFDKIVVDNTYSPATTPSGKGLLYAITKNYTLEKANPTDTMEIWVKKVNK